MKADIVTRQRTRGIHNYRRCLYK